MLINNRGGIMEKEDNIIDFKTIVLRKELEVEKDLSECNINFIVLNAAIQNFKNNIFAKKLNNKERKLMSQLAYDLLKFASNKNKDVW